MGTITYDRDGRIARITLNRPEKLNAINDEMPGELRDAVTEAGTDDRVHLIVLSGAGSAFCAGYDLELYAETEGPTKAVQSMPWDGMTDYAIMGHNTDCFMSLWRCLKPVLCKVQGHAVGGGSDIALCADMIVMAEEAKIGYPPARVWGCPTTAMWVYRVGVEQAKRLLFTGELIGGVEAANIGLVMEAVPESALDSRVEELAGSIAGVPRSQLMIQKLVINQALESQGLRSAQLLATVMDGISRHSPSGVAFKRTAERVGFKQAVAEQMAAPAPRGKK